MRERYAAAARAAAEGTSGAGCCGGSTTLRVDETEVFGERLYAADERDGATERRSAARWLGVPTASPTAEGERC